MSLSRDTYTIGAVRTPIRGASRGHPTAVTDFLAVALAALLSLAAAAPGEFRGRVIGVSDGDTLTVLHERRREKVRLHGIDAPEKGQPFGERAKEVTAQLVFGREVAVRSTGQDRHGRTMAEVILPDGRHLNRELVRAGYAWWYRRYSTDRTLGALEAQARAARSGLWADPRAIPPWEWRARRVGAAIPTTGRVPAR